MSGRGSADPAGVRGPTAVGLPSLMRRGVATEILFLYECTAFEPAQLRPIAEKLGVTVQAASHSFRRLAERGLAEFRDGRYRATVAGVAWLHGTLTDLGEDLDRRTARLHLIRSCRAVALDDLAAGDAVSLELRDGLLGARRGSSGPSRGRAAAAAVAGSLVEVEALEGILPLPKGRVDLLTVDPDRAGDPPVRAELARRVAAGDGLLAAPSLEGYHLLVGVTKRPILRFGVAAACAEAARVGVDCQVVLLEEELARFLEAFAGPDPPTLTVSRLGDGRRRPRRRGSDR